MDSLLRDRLLRLAGVELRTQAPVVEDDEEQDDDLEDEEDEEDIEDDEDLDDDVYARHRTLELLGVELRARGYNPAPGRQVFTAEGAKKYGLPIGATITPGMRRLTEAQQQKVADLPEAEATKYQAARKGGATHTQALAAAKGAPPKKAPAKKAAPKTPAAKEKAAVDRQAKIDKVRGTAETLAETLELLGNDASNDVLEHRINAQHRKGSIDEKTRDRLLAAVGDRNAIGKIIDELAAENGLTLVGEPLEVRPFKRGDGLNGLKGGFAEGTFVTVVRPGVRYDPGDGEVLVVQGLVEEADADEIAAFKKAAGRKKAGDTTDALQSVPARGPAARTFGKGAVELRPDETSALDDYGSDGQEINDKLRAGGRLGSRLRRTVAGIDSAMGRSRLTSDVQVWRGSGSGSEIGDMSGDLTGNEWTEPAYLSTTADERIALDFARLGSTPVVMSIKAPTGTGAVAVSDRPNAFTRLADGTSVHMLGGGQGEILMERGLRLRAVADHGVDERGVRHLDVEIVPSTPDSPTPGPARLDARQIASGLGSDADFNHGNGNYLDDVQERLDAGESPGRIAKDLDDSARTLSTLNAVEFGGADPEALAAGRAKVQRLRDLAERLRGTRRPRATPAKRAPANKAVPARTDAVAAMVRDNFVGPQEATAEQVDLAAGAVSRLSVPQLRELHVRMNALLPNVKGKQASREELEYSLFSQVVGHGRRSGGDGVARALEGLAARADQLAAASPARKAVPGTPDLSPDPAVRQIEVENRIRAAYSAVLARKTNQGNRWVGLAELREELGEDLPRAEVDAALIRLGLSGASLVPEDNQKALRRQDRDAAVLVGGRDHHNIRIEDPTPRPVPTPESADADLDPVESLRDDLDLKTKADLRAMIDEVNKARAKQGLKRLPVSGLKRELVDRLVDAQAGAGGTKGADVGAPAASTATGLHRSASAPSLRDFFPPPGQSPTREQQERLNAAIGEALNGEYPGGLRVVDAGGGFIGDGPDPKDPFPGGHIYISAAIQDASGKQVGWFRRNVSYSRSGDTADTPLAWIAYHDKFQIDPEVQGQGFAKAFNGNMFDWYRRSGIEYVDLGAGMDVGGYAWASQGFDFRTRDDLESFAIEGEGMNTEFKKQPGFPGYIEPGTLFETNRELARQQKLLSDAIARVEAGEWVSAYEFSQLGRKPGQGKDDWWIGKAILLNGGFSGRLTL